ncbi:MAG: cadherin-like beta sandwich domain-containing protein [Spirochaetales bacterium]|nr:cadherin-like beta sandwich domain-containing protein [Spirochaetales bacterium]
MGRLTGRTGREKTPGWLASAGRIAAMAAGIAVLTSCPVNLMESIEQMVREASTSPHLVLKCLNTSTVIENEDTYPCPATLVGFPSALEFQITNSGDRELVVEVIGIVPGSGDVGDYALTPPGLPLTIDPAGSDSFDVAFDPGSIGSKQVQVRIVHNAPEADGELRFWLRGTAVSEDASLAGLAVSVGTLYPAFSPGTYSYTVAVDHTVSSIRVTPTAASADATIKVNGTQVTSGSSSAPIDLNYGNNDIYVEVTAAAGGTLGYTIKVTRDDPPSTNANLASLQLSSETLSPSFSPFINSYSASVLFETASIGVTAATDDPEATMTVNGASTASGSTANMGLSVGGNTCTIVATAEAGNTNTYTITITRKANAALASLLVKVEYPENTATVSLEPPFASTTYKYYFRANAASKSFLLTPTASDPAAASIVLNGSSIGSGTERTFAAQPELNTFSLVVTAGSGATEDVRTYALFIYVPLTNLAVTGQITSYGTGDDGALRRGLSWEMIHDGRFQPKVVEKVAVVDDVFTKLEWIGTTASPRSWTDALAYAEGGFAGTKDWRIPNVHELESLMNYGTANDSWLEASGFKDVFNAYYWTSTTCLPDTTYAYVMNLGRGAITKADKTNYEDYYVLLVRSLSE